MGAALERAPGQCPKTLARYLRLCSRLAGVTDEIELEDALGIASFLVAMGRVPPPSVWVDGFIEQAQSDRIEAFF